MYQNPLLKKCYLPCFQFKEPIDGVQETKLRVTYIFPPQTESSKSDGSRAKASDVQQMAWFLDVKLQVLTFPCKF